MSDYKPIGDVLKNVSIWEMPEGCEPVDAIVIVKYFDEEGELSWLSRLSERLNTSAADFEVLGVLNAFGFQLKQELASRYMPEEDIEDEDSEGG